MQWFKGLGLNPRRIKTGRITSEMQTFSIEPAIVSCFLVIHIVFQSRVKIEEQDGASH